MHDLKHPPNNRILIIDDNFSIHADFQKILGDDENQPDKLSDAKVALFGTDIVRGTGNRFSIDSAYQGQQGLEMVQQALREQRPYSVAFVDIRMPPGWDGIETVKHIWVEDPHLQVVLCTAYTDYSWDDIIAELGLGDSLFILKKPFDIIEVCQLASALTAKWNPDRETPLKLKSPDEIVADLVNSLQKADCLQLLLDRE